MLKKSYKNSKINTESDKCRNNFMIQETESDQTCLVDFPSIN